MRRAIAIAGARPARELRLVEREAIERDMPSPLLVGDELPNIPWQPRPSGSSDGGAAGTADERFDVIWKNPEP